MNLEYQFKKYINDNNITFEELLDLSSLFYTIIIENNFNSKINILLQNDLFSEQKKLLESSLLTDKTVLYSQKLIELHSEITEKDNTIQQLIEENNDIKHEIKYLNQEKNNNNNNIKEILSIYMNSVNTKLDNLSTAVIKNSSSNHIKGAEAEKCVIDYLNKKNYRAHPINQEEGGGDILVSYKELLIGIEVKNHNTTIKSKDMQIFREKIKTYKNNGNNINCAIFISTQDVSMARIKNYHYEELPIDNNCIPCLFITNFYSFPDILDCCIKTLYFIYKQSNGYTIDKNLLINIQTQINQNLPIISSIKSNILSCQKDLINLENNIKLTIESLIKENEKKSEEND